ncbi:MAG: tyrosine-type recombinase/integrase [Hyphomicrobiaceae bacterium]|nr:tyrosine-type recombinase/integrase [Hyphomicrobiaceae bacterium]
MVRRATDTIGRYGLMPTDDGWFVFWYEPDEHGKPRRSRRRLGLKKSTPVSQAKATFRLWVRSFDAAISQDQKMTIGVIVALYIESKRKEGKKHRKMEWQWVPMREKFADLQPADLETPIEVDGEVRTICHEYAVEREAAGMARDTIHSELSLLRTAMRWAEKRRKVPEVYVWVPSPGKGRKTALTEDQLVRLLGAIVEAPPHIKLAFLIALATGARKQAIIELTWPRVDLVFRRIDFNNGLERPILDTGHGKGRAIVDISDGLYDALVLAKEFASCDWVIEWRGGPVQDIKKGVRAVFVAAGLGKRYMGLHVLRHTLATAAAELGIDMRKIQVMLGHDDINTTEKIYVEFRRGYVRDVAQVADAHIQRVNDPKYDQKSHPCLLIDGSEKTSILDD